jgi:hypothetical protein
MRSATDAIKRWVRFLSGAPFENLPTEFGDPVPSDLREFENESKEAQRRPQGSVRVPRPRRSSEQAPLQSAPESKNRKGGKST